MSLSNPTPQQVNQKTENPCKLFLEWSSDGFFSFYEKEIGQKKTLQLPIKLYVLDTLLQIKGYNDLKKKSYYSNAIKPDMVSSRKFKIYLDGELIEEALMSELKQSDDLGNKEFKNRFYKTYTILYCALKKEEDVILCAISLKGDALSQFFEYKKKNDIERHGIVINNCFEKKHGASRYKLPLFERYDDEKHKNYSIEMDREILQPYFKEYFKEVEIEKKIE